MNDITGGYSHALLLLREAGGVGIDQCTWQPVTPRRYACTTQPYGSTYARVPGEPVTEEDLTSGCTEPWHACAEQEHQIYVGLGQRQDHVAACHPRREYEFV
jgi:hypothetical protein